MISSNNNIYLLKYYLNICLSFVEDITNFKIVADEMRCFKCIATAINKLHKTYFTYFHPRSLQSKKSQSQ